MCNDGLLLPRTLAPIQDRFVASLALTLKPRESQFGHFLLDISQQHREQHHHRTAALSRQNCSLARAIIMTYFQEGSGLFSAPNDGGMQQVSKRNKCNLTAGSAAAARRHHVAAAPARRTGSG